METLLREADKNSGGPKPYPEVAKRDMAAKYDEAKENSAEMEQIMALIDAKKGK